MAKKRRKKKASDILPRSGDLAKIAKEDPTRLHPRTVKPKKGGGHKQRPRDNNRIRKEQGLIE